MYEGGKVFDLTVKVHDDDKANMEQIGNLMIDANGQKVPLHYVAEILPMVGPNSIAGKTCNGKSLFRPMLPDVT